MEAGRALDMQIAEQVMGWQRYGAERQGRRCVVLVAKYLECWAFTRSQSDKGTWESTTDDLTELRNIPAYSTDIAAAWLVVEWATKYGNITIQALPYAVWVEIRIVSPAVVKAGVDIDMASDFKTACLSAPTAPHAICLAALKVVEAH